MSTEADIREKFWKALKSDRTLMLGIAGSREHSQPMTAQLDGENPSSPLWIFSSKDTLLVQAIGAGQRGMAQFVSKGHDLFACIEGELTLDNNRTMIERLWNPYVAAWYEGGKDDPKLQLIRFDPEHAQVWLNENSLFAGVKLLLGADPEKEYADKTADVDLRGGPRA
ncbi:pyridoxamine 5'-phosphate oxidase family protein [Vitreimonas flagellata]|uniref:pyridoxamine 5'-phosphate oxidase family protein n=1 Tax=Vitreimonas flagellata TaxID=2560861 RepID=UPI0010757C68|nr:pyridoxamine 5'-phosphate oxidase family protein [Vitreimonas flagellata]